MEQDLKRKTVKSKVCPNCKQEKVAVEFGMDRRSKTGLKSWCKVCSNKHRNDYRKKNPYQRYTFNSFIKETCRRFTSTLINYGFIEEPDECEVCGSDERLHAHHLSYENPLDVVFVCHKCHNQIHNDEKENRKSTKRTHKFPVRMDSSSPPEGFMGLHDGGQRMR